jgi:tetratricopeptide (TPR) repeat protein
MLAAENLFREVLGIRRRTGSDWQVGQSLTDLGNVLRLQNKTSETEAAFREAINFLRKTKDQLLLANALHQLGHATGAKPLESEQAYREALEIRRRAGDDAQVCHSLVALGNRIREQPHRLAEAEQLYAEALRIRRKLVSPGDPKLVELLGRLTSVQTLQAKHAAALPLLKEIQEIRQRTLPKGHADIAAAEKAVDECARQLAMSQEVRSGSPGSDRAAGGRDPAASTPTSGPQSSAATRP